MESTHPVLEAARIVGSQAALASLLQTSKQNVHHWTRPGKQVPADYCPAIERLTHGKVACELLRPDIDWSYLRRPAKKK